MISSIRVCIFIGTLAAAVFGQSAISGHQDNQSWDDIQLTVPITKKVDFFTKGTFRFGKNVTRLNDGRWAAGIVWKLNKAFSVSPFYWYVEARNAAGQFRTEHRLSLAVSYKFPFKVVGLTHRSTFERRFRNPLDSWRYRAQLTLDRDIPKKIIPGAKWFVSDEVFYDSLLKRFSRNRFAIGITKTINTHLSLDIYYMRQNDGITRPGDLNVIWTAWKIKL